MKDVQSQAAPPPNDRLRRSLKKVVGSVASVAVVGTSAFFGAATAMAEPLNDNAESIYVVRGPAGTATNGFINEVNTESSSVIDPAAITGQRHGNASGSQSRQSNALGISADGTLVYTVDNGTNGYQNTAQNALKLRQYNTETGLTQVFDIPSDFRTNGGNVTLRGAVSPVNGIYYFSGNTSTGAGAETLVYAYNPANDAIFRVGLFVGGRTDGGVSPNGDFAFGRNGTLYVMVAGDLYEVPAASLPTTPQPNTHKITMKHLKLIPAITARNAQGANGIAFGGDGVAYGTVGSANGDTYLLGYDIASDEIVSDEVLGTGFTDAASVHFPNTLTLKINVIGRENDSDQFRLDIVGEGNLLGADATTTGAQNGVQTQYAGAVIAKADGNYEVGTSAASGTDLDDYELSIVCTDADGATVDVTGAGPDWDLQFPNVKGGTDVECLITAIPGTEEVLPPATNNGATSGPQGIPDRWTPEPIQGTAPLDPSSLTLLDAAGDPVPSVAIPNQGTYTVDGDELVFTPEPQFVGAADPIDYRISDTEGLHAEGTYRHTTIAVTPVAVNDSTTGRPNASQSVNPLDNDTAGHPSVPLVPETLTLVGAVGGEVIVDEGVYTIEDGEIVFTPNLNYFGIPTPVQYSVQDANGTTASAVYQPEIVADGPSTNEGFTSGPQGLPQSWTPSPEAGEDFPIVPDSLTLLDAAGDPATSVTILGEGTYTIADGKLVFTPELQFVGEATPVDYRVTDEGGQHAINQYTPTLVAVTPVAADDSSTGRPNTPQSVDPLANDNPGDPGVPLVPSTLALVGADDDGSVTVPEGVYTIEDGKIVFTPNTNYFGTPTPVEYCVADANGTVACAVYQPDVEGSAPTTDNGTTSGPQGLPQSWTPSPEAGEDFPIDLSTLTLLDAAGDPVTSVTIPGEGTYTIVEGKLVFTPELQFVGVATPVDYEVSDIAGQPATGTYTPTFVAVTPVAVNDSSTGRPNTPQSVDPLVNDTPGNPEVPLVPSTLTLTDADPETGDVTVPEGVYSIEEGKIVFTPNENYFGTPTPVEYCVADANGTEACADYQPVVDATGPITDNGTTTGPQGLPQSWTPSPEAGDDFPIVPGSLTLLDGEGIPVPSVTIPNQGTYTIADGKLVFTPEPQFVGAATPVSYRVSDEAGQPAQGTYTPTFVAVTPVAVNDSSTGFVNTPQSVDPLVNDNPGNPGVPLVPSTLELVGADPTGKVTVTEGVYTIEDGKIVFTPNQNYVGTPTPVQYCVADANGTTACAVYQPVVNGPEASKDLAQTLVCEAPAVFDMTAEVAGLNPATVALLNEAGTAVTTLKVDGEGTWTVDTTTGKITFKPEGCFLGKVTPIQWQGVLEDGTPVTGQLDITYKNEMPATGMNLGTTLGLIGFGTLLLGAGAALIGFRRSTVSE